MEQKPVRLWQVILPGGLLLLWCFLALRDFQTGAATISRLFSVFCVLCWLAAFACCLVEYTKQK